MIFVLIFCTIVLAQGIGSAASLLGARDRGERGSLLALAVITMYIGCAIASIVIIANHLSGS